MKTAQPQFPSNTDVHMHLKTAAAPETAPAPVVEAAWLRQLCLDAGADDAGFVEIQRPALAAERSHLERAFPRARSLISIVVRMNRDNVRSQARSVANNEFHHTTDETNVVARKIVAALERAGVRALCPPAGFPMEAGRWMAERMWLVSHKPVAVAAGLGRMGIHRNVIHPRFGNFILLGTILLGAEVSEYARELDFNPCLTCKLCVAACPVGAIGADGHFDFSACYTHNYREFMGGFNDWVETVAESRGGLDYRRRVKESETVSTWQSLAFGPNYKAAYCMAVCPAGEEVISLYQQSKKDYTAEVLRPLQEKVEPLYVIAGSDAEAHARKKFPRKELRHVRGSLRPQTLRTLIEGMPLTFQREASTGLEARYHFTFTGKETAEVTVDIHDKALSVQPGLHGKPDLRVSADGEAWLRFVRGETSILKELLLRRVRLKGSIKLLQAFGRCFPN
jgi:epoxyqueuosine reductase QueG